MGECSRHVNLDAVEPNNRISFKQKIDAVSLIKIMVQ